MSNDESRAPTGELAELLECERELAELLARARQEARHRIEFAQRDAARAAAELEASLEAEAERERARIRADLRARVRAIHLQGRERAAHYDDVPEERIDELAEGAFRALVAAGGAA